jgi:hypothetical protein
MCVCVSLCRQRPWRWTDPPPKESYQISKGSISKKEKSDPWKRHKEYEKGEEEEEYYLIARDETGCPSFMNLSVTVQCSAYQRF